jgi:hypothetical protein
MFILPTLRASSLQLDHILKLAFEGVPAVENELCRLLDQLVVDRRVVGHEHHDVLGSESLSRQFDRLFEQLSGAVIALELRHVRIVIVDERPVGLQELDDVHGR